MWTVRVCVPLLLLACAGGENPTDPSETGASDTGTADTGSADTDTDTSDELPDAPTGDGVIIAELSYDGTVETVRCPDDGTDYGLISVTQETLNFNRLNHSGCTVDSGNFVTFALLNVPLSSTTALPTAEGTTPIDVSDEVDGIATRRSVHEATSHSWTVEDWGSGTLRATFEATYDNGYAVVWFLDAPMEER